MPVLPDMMAFDAPSETHPFRLVAAPSRSFLNTSFTETPGSIAREKRPTAMMHPEDCAALGVGDGDRVRLGNTRGSVVVRAKPFTGVQRGVVIVEGIWPNHAFEEGIGINTLTSAEPGYPNGGGCFHDTAVWIRPAEAVRLQGPTAAAAE
jgi:anaerobic selenocysteine-containing dehydrogenase